MKKAIFTPIVKLAESLQTGHIDPEIEFETKSHYGGPELVYVLSKHKEPLSVLTNSKTLTPRHVKALKDLGFSFKNMHKDKVL
jgi:hypothetical protein